MLVFRQTIANFIDAANTKIAEVLNGMANSNNGNATTPQPGTGTLA